MFYRLTIVNWGKTKITIMNILFAQCNVVLKLMLTILILH